MPRVKTEKGPLSCRMGRTSLLQYEIAAFAGMPGFRQTLPGGGWLARTAGALRGGSERRQGNSGRGGVAGSRAADPVPGHRRAGGGVGAAWRIIRRGRDRTGAPRVSIAVCPAACRVRRGGLRRPGRRGRRCHRQGSTADRSTGCGTCGAGDQGGRSWRCAWPSARPPSSHEAEERRQAEAALVQSQKMEALGQLAGGVAHDFNNLLMVIMGGLEIVRRTAPEDNARLRRAADTAVQGAQRAVTLTQRLLAFCRRQPLNPRPTDINRLIRDMTDLLHGSLGETIELEGMLAARHLAGRGGCRTA